MLVDLLIDASRNRGDIMAVSDALMTLTYRRLGQFAQVCRDFIARATNRPRVGLLLPASGAFSGCLFGTLWAHKTPVPLNFLLSAEELAAIVRAAGLDTVVTVKHFAELVGKLPATPLFLEDQPIKRHMVAKMLRRIPAPPRVAPDDTAVLLFTSGTSAEPKGVELTYRNLHSNCLDCIATANIQPDHTFLNCLPPFHVFGLTANVLVPVALGASVHSIPRFSPTAVADVFRKHTISVFMAIPSMYAAVLRLKSAPPDLMKHTYLPVSGGEPLPDAIADGYRERFGVRLYQGYGLTETAPVCTLELPDANRNGSIGRPIRNVDVRIVGDDGAELPAGADGEIWIKGPNVMRGYLDNADATRRVITPDGWFKTGDAGHVDADGFVSITGRLKDMMIVGGENVFPREIEQVLERHPAIATVAVIGLPDASRGEAPVAFVTLKDGATATEIELRDFARASLARYKVPRQVHIHPDLPRGPTGKILKRRLPELL